MFAVNNVLKCIIKSNDAEEHRGKEGEEAGREEGGIVGIEASAKKNFREGNCPESRLKSLTTSRMVVVVVAGDRGGGAFMT